MVKNDAPHKNEIKVLKIAQSSIDTSAVTDKGSPTNPKARSNTARFTTKKFAAVCKDLVFQIFVKFKAFPIRAVQPKKRFKAERKIVFNSTSCGHILISFAEFFCQLIGA